MESYPWKIALEHFNNKKSVHSGRLKHHMLFAVKAVNLKKKKKHTHKKPLMLHLQPDLSLLHNATSTNQVLHIYRAYKV